MTAGVLGLDLATRIGWACRLPGGAVIFGSHRLPTTGEDVGWFLEAYHDWLDAMMMSCAIEAVGYEAPWIGNDTSQATAWKLLGLAAHTEFLARRRGIPFHRQLRAHNASVRLHYTGRGNGPRKLLKQLTMDAARNRGFAPRNDDEADGLAVLDFTIHKLRLPGAVAGPLFGSAAQ